MLRTAGVTAVVLGLATAASRVEAELDRVKWPRSEIVSNSRFELGSVLTVHTAAEALRRGGVLMMDAEVLYDERIAMALIAGDAAVNRVLIDRDFEADDEPVTLCVRGRVPIEGNFDNMRRLLRKLEQRGIAGVCIEDPQFPNTNRFLNGERQPFADIEEFAGKIAAGKDTQTDPDFSIGARVEPLARTLFRLSTIGDLSAADRQSLLACFARLLA